VLIQFDPTLRSAGSARFMLACSEVALDVSVVGGIRAVIGWHSPDVAFDPK